MGEPTPHDVNSEELKKRAVNLFTFLREVVSLRTKVVRDLESYEAKIWLADIPREPECQCVAWEKPKDDEQDGTWLSVRKPKLLQPPKLPSEIDPWVNPNDLGDSSKEPDLYERILVETEGSGEEAGEPDTEPGSPDGEGPKFISLEDRPEIRGQWEDYLARRWRTWAEQDRRKQSVQRVYMDLFALYQQQKELGEAYEVFLGLGQLRWTLPSGQPVNRHLIAVQIGLEFDPARGVITVGPSADGAKPRLEQDMLEPSERPDPEIQERIEKDLAGVEDDVWHSEVLIAGILAWVNSVAEGQGAYVEGLAPLSGSPGIPTVSLAPALVLRKRTADSVLKCTAGETHRRRSTSRGVR